MRKLEYKIIKRRGSAIDSWSTRRESKWQEKSEMKRWEQNESTNMRLKNSYRLIRLMPMNRIYLN